jgi:hypothetical protein
MRITRYLGTLLIAITVSSIVNYALPSKAYITNMSMEGSYTFRSCPALYAEVSFADTSGFISVFEVRPGTTEFVLPPGSIGEIVVRYYSKYNDLTGMIGEGSVPVWRIDIESETMTTVTNMVRTFKVEVEDIHNLTVYYLVNATEAEKGVYLIGFPSTCYRAILVVGDEPYYGPLPWDNMWEEIVAEVKDASYNRSLKILTSIDESGFLDNWIYRLIIIMGLIVVLVIVYLFVKK